MPRARALLGRVKAVPPAHVGGRSCLECAAPMAPLSLAVRGPRPVVVDHCARCRKVWFDELESVRLSGLGWVQLLRELQRPAAEAMDGGLAQPVCPLCRQALRPVVNRTRFGVFSVLECPDRHGHWQGHAALLAERGLLRPLLGPERRALREERRRLVCINCGAAADGEGTECSHCGSPLGVVDAPRLAHALRVQSASAEASPAPDGVYLPWPCRSCGAPIDPSRDVACPSCAHAVVVPSLLDVSPLLDDAERWWRAQPAPPRLEPRPRLARTWRDTQVARLGRWLNSPDDQDELPPSALRWAAAVIVLLLVWALVIGLPGRAEAATSPPGRIQDGSVAAQAFRAQVLGADPAAAWHWAAAAAATRPADDAGALLRGLLDVYLASAEGATWPAQTTLAQVTMRGGPLLPIDADAQIRVRWTRGLMQQLQAVWPEAPVPVPPELDTLAPRMTAQAPGLWSSTLADGQPRAAIWLLTLRHIGQLPLALQGLTATLRVNTGRSLDFDCTPPRGTAAPVLRAGDTSVWLCRSHRSVAGDDPGLRDAAARLRARNPPLLLLRSADTDTAEAVRRMGERLAASVASPVDAFYARFVACESRADCAQAKARRPEGHPALSRRADPDGAARADDRPRRPGGQLVMATLGFLLLAVVYALLAFLLGNSRAARFTALAGVFIVPTLLTRFGEPGSLRSLMGPVPDAPSFGGLFIVFFYVGGTIVMWWGGVLLLWLFYKLAHRHRS